MLPFGALMLTGGKLADLFGRRLMFVVGLAIFTAASQAQRAADWLAKRTVKPVEVSEVAA